MSDYASKKYSNNDYKKLGDRIRADFEHITESDYEMLQYLRTSYKEPLSITFNFIEKLAHKVDSDSVCTYRIKRIESIVSKLRRFPKMHVNRAEDIAGCRCILTSEEKVYELFNLILKKEKQLPFEIQGKINDYISSPKESGYKSIHLNVCVKGTNKRIEIQLRSLLHHSWATLVETTDLLYGLKLKEIGQDSNEELFNLHYLLSKEITTLSISEMHEIADTVISYKYIQTLGNVYARNYLSVRNHWNSLRLQNSHFFLIATNKEGVPEIKGFSSFDNAEAAYFESFVNNKDSKNIVLTHFRQPHFAKISVAYSNYFLTFNNTLIQILYILSEAVKASFQRSQIMRFNRYYQAFLDIMLFWMEKQVLEIQSYQSDSNIKRSKKKNIEWASNIYVGVQRFKKIFKDTQLQLKPTLGSLLTIHIMKNKFKAFQVAVQNLANEHSTN